MINYAALKTAQRLLLTARLQPVQGHTFPPPLQRLRAIPPLSAVSTFGGDPVGPMAIALTACLPETYGGFQNPKLGFFAYPREKVYFAALLSG